ncbi:hypothetical protein AALO_G00092440, partial [Alosa alosa]
HTVTATLPSRPHTHLHHSHTSSIQYSACNSKSLHHTCSTLPPPPSPLHTQHIISSGSFSNTHPQHTYSTLSPQYTAHCLIRKLLQHTYCTLPSPHIHSTLSHLPCHPPNTHTKTPGSWVSPLSRGSAQGFFLGKGVFPLLPLLLLGAPGWSGDICPSCSWVLLVGPGTFAPPALGCSWLVRGHLPLLLLGAPGWSGTFSVEKRKT